MSGFLLRSILSGITLVCGIVAMPGIFVDSLGTTLLGATVLGLANGVIRPVLSIYGDPQHTGTLGWTTLLMNIALPMLAFVILPGIEIHSKIATLLIIVAMTTSSFLLTRYIQDR